MSSSNFYKTICNQSPAAMSILDLKGRFIEVNQSLCNFLGYSKDEILGETTALLSHPNEVEITSRKLQQLTSGEIESIQLEKCYLHKKGHPLWGLVSFTLIRDHDNRPTFIIGQLQDITEKVMIQQQLMESEDRYRRLVELSPEAIFVHLNGRIVYVNRVGIKLLGAKNKDEIIGTPSFSFIPDEERDLIREETVALLNQTTSKKLRHSIIRYDGKSLSAITTAARITYNGERAIQTVIRDITEQKMMEEWLRKSEKLSVVGQLAAGVAHEIRNPLTSIKGFIQLAKSNQEFKQEHLDIMLTELERTEGVIYEFLSLAKPNDQVKFQKHDVKTILTKVITLLDSQALMKDIEIVTSLGHLPEIDCDENQLKQVFINIIQNALEASPRKGAVYVHLDQINDDNIIIRISDHGPGMPKDRLKRLGEPFYSTKEKGTGLGLMVSCKIVENHQGKINFSSKEGKGTTVDIVLPFEQRLSHIEEGAVH
ncbi:PAS domain-containing sensor histidine kinase [Desertibacillus haloalkaliphilus]|uniref:PAS domain-containing sensor histidine kinase n=1 Tax=Desertibacillus haloalkaliphilus TaxID=1328930 RepID=UPI001C27E031|nr:PAS domain S-box protein [Desertibacillus haloalkaliphilus]MBU8907700.1 PAS domain S-box protein [Desertibacillus haloalkaliphilus]